VVDEGLHKPVTFLGLLQTAMGVGAIAGGVGITALIPRTGDLRPVPFGLSLVAAGCAMQLVPSVPVVAVGMAVLGAGLPITLVCLTTLLQRRTPPAMQGRVFTTFETVSGLPQVLSIAVGAALVAVVDFHVLLSVMSAGIALSALYAAVRLREVGEPSALDDPAGVHVDVPVGAHLAQQPPVVADEQQRPVVRP
jgi:MFS family permease